jgi:hypothetical protein
MSGLTYQYDVKILERSPLLRSGRFSKSIENCGEMIIVSKQFDNYNECSENLMHLLSDLAADQSYLDGRDFVILTKTNPQGAAPESTDTWPRTIVYRSYVLDSDLLKNKIMDYTIVGQVNMGANLLPAIPQI